jgi:GAF domain-containing protein
MRSIPWSIILDPQRLSELRSLNILDTGPEQSYDDLAEIARMICDAPVANVTLVAEDRQWFKSYIGNDVRETPVSQSICAHALDKADALVIKDLTEDDRTRDNTLVTGEAALRFYAGAPLRLDGDFGVGTLCVLDTKPHPDGLSPAQLAALQALGRQATILLHVRRYLAAQNKPAEDGIRSGGPFEDIADALLAAYKMNKELNDKMLESLIASSLTHIALRLTRDDKTKR